MKPFGRRARWAGTALAFLILTGNVAAQGEPGGVLGRMIELDLPAQPLADSLIALSQTSAAQLIAADELVRPWTAPAVRGRMSLQEALRRLLAGTGLGFQARGANTVGIEAPGPKARTSERELDGLFESTAAAAPEQTDEPDPSETVALAERVEPEVEPRRPSPRLVEEIIVTATRRAESVRDIAASITALSGQQIEDAGVQEIDGIIDAVAGVNLVEDNSGYKRVTVRGISAGIGQNDTVGIFVDETPFTDVLFAFATPDLNPFDLASVEVVKGPVGTLFGGSALNGAIRYIPQMPIFDEWDAKFFSQIEDNAESRQIGRNSGLAFNAPIGAKLAVRMVANSRESAGIIDSRNQSYMADDVDRVSQDTLRAMLRWAPLDALDLSLMYLDQSTLVHDVGYADVCCESDFERTATPQASPTKTSFRTWQLKGIWAFDWAELTLVASDSDKRFTGLSDSSYIVDDDPPTSLLAAELLQAGRPRSQEIRLVSPDLGRWSWIAGLFNYRYKVFGDVRTIAGQGTADGDAGSTLIDAVVTEKAAFGELSWRPVQALELSGGLRMYEFSYSGERITQGATCVASDPTCLLTDQQATLDLDQSEAGVSPKFGLKWTMSERTMSYLSVARGFRFGGVNGAFHQEVPPVYTSDTLWSYEAGLRAGWLDETLLTDVTAFYTDWSDAQFFTVTSDGRAGYTDNVGAVQGHGVEFQLGWLTPLPDLKLDLSAAYARIETAEDYTQQTATGPGATTPAGAPWPRAPKWQTVTSLAWSRPLGAAQLNVSLGHNHFGRAIQGFGPSDPFVFGYSTYDLQVSLDAPWWGSGLGLVLNVNNLTNKQASIFRTANLRRYNTPRNVSMRVGFDF